MGEIESGLAGRVHAEDALLERMAQACDGDARRALTLLETAAELTSRAAAGYFTEELEAIVHVPAKDALRQLVERGRLQRRPCPERYLYGAAERARWQEQWAARQTQADQLPASGFTPKGMPGYDELHQDSEWEPETADMVKAKALMAEVANPNKEITLLLNDSPGHKEIAVAIQAAWKELGLDVTIKQQEWAQFLEFLGQGQHVGADGNGLGLAGLVASITL